jgi:predicted dehydrogenase
MLVEGAIHLLDYLRWITGCDPVSVWGQSFNLPWSIPESYGLESAPQTCAYAQFEMAQPGTYAPLHVCFRSVVSRLRQDSWLSHMQIEGDRGTIRIDSDRVYLNDEEVPVAWDDDRSISDLQLDRLNSTVLREFLAWRAGGPEPGFSGRNNLPSIGMVFGVIRSWQTGRRVAIPSSRP